MSGDDAANLSLREAAVTPPVLTQIAWTSRVHARRKAAFGM